MKICVQFKNVPYMFEKTVSIHFSHKMLLRILVVEEKRIFRSLWLTHIFAIWWICIRQTPKLVGGFLPIQRKTFFFYFCRLPLSPYPNLPIPSVTQLHEFRPSVNNIFCSGNTLGVFSHTVFHICVSTATQTNFVFNPEV